MVESWKWLKETHGAWILSIEVAENDRHSGNGQRDLQ